MKLQATGLHSVRRSWVVLLSTLLLATRIGGASEKPATIWAHDNLVAWCAVPFDGKARGPEARAEMLQRLGFKHFAYDWRDKDIPTFDAEMDALKKHGIELSAWWFPAELPEATQDLTLEAFKRHDAHPQLWIVDGVAPATSPEDQKAKVNREADRIAALDKKAAAYGCRVELYNHNGWFGMEENQLAIIDRLKELGVTDVGMVYNFSHAHDAEHDDSVNFAELWKKIMPHVVAVNVTGLGDQWQPIIYLSEGQHEMDMMRIIQDSGWHGLVGLPAEKGGGKVDAEVTLRNYLKSIDWVAAELKKKGAGGPRPSFINLGAGHFGKAFDATSGGLRLPNQDALRTPPITVELWSKLHSDTNFNILVACDPKSSSRHWELYSYAGNGNFSVYLPGMGGEVQSPTPICDDKWHYLAMVLEPSRIRLYVDGKLAKDAPVTAPQGSPAPGDIGIGQIGDGGGDCDGMIQDVRISKGVRGITAIPAGPFKSDASTIELWMLDKMPAHQIL